jgi:hypothetical protein
LSDAAKAEEKFAHHTKQVMRQGFHDICVQENPVLIFSELMDSSSLFLTASADTFYFPQLRRPEQWADGGRDGTDGARHLR